MLISLFKRYALKAIINNKNQPLEEAGILLKVNNEYLISYVDSFLENQGINYCMVMDYCEI